PRLFGFRGELAYCSQETFRRLRGSYFAVQQVGERHHLAIQKAGGVFVLSNRGTVEINASKDAAGPRVAENFGFHLPVSTGGGIASNWTSRGRCASTNFEFAGKQISHTLVIHDQHY